VGDRVGRNLRRGDGEVRKEEHNRILDNIISSEEIDYLLMFI